MIENRPRHPGGGRAPLPRTRRTTQLARYVLIISGLGAVACSGPAEEERPLVTERDSAGITIVENVDPVAAPLWTVSAEPLWVRGGMDAPEEEQLYLVSGGTRLSDGRVVVTNAGSREVRVLAPDGSPLASHGGEGDGPGEFRTVELEGVLPGDTLLVWDQTLQRMSLVHPDGGVARTYPVAWTGEGFPAARGALADGSLVIGGGMSFSSEEGFPTGVIRPRSTFGWVRPDGEEVHLVDLPAAEMYARASDAGFMARGLPFARFATAASAPDGVWLGDNESFEVRFFAQDGRLARVVRAAAPPRPVTEADIEAHIQQELDEEGADENRQRELRSLIREMPVPEVMPPYQGLLVDTQGALWVEVYSPPGDGTEGGLWTVFDAQGHLQSRVRTPPRTRLLEVGPDYILATTRDEFDVESLTMWSLDRSPM